jgi:hypothetical protein
VKYENNPDGTNEAQANKNEKQNIPHHQNSWYMIVI